MRLVCFILIWPYKPVIPKSDTTTVSMTHYELLGVSQDATREEIDSAYRRASKAFHPDAGGPVSNPALFRMVVEARTVLTNSHDREEYDAELLGAQYSQRSSNVTGPSPPQHSTKGKTTRPPTNSPGTTPRKKKQRSYSLLAIAGTDYVVSRWIIQFGFRIHAALVTNVGHQLMGFAFFPVIAFLVIPKGSILRFWVRFRAVLSKHHKINATRLRTSRTTSSSKI